MSEKFVAWRFMLKATDRGQFTPMTLFAWAAIAIGVAAMTCLLSVMYGFESTLIDKVLKAYPHVRVVAKNNREFIVDNLETTMALKGVSQVERVVSFLERDMIFQSSTRTSGGVVWGIDPQEMSRLEKDIESGRLPQINSKIPEVLLGSELAVHLNAKPGSELVVISPLSQSGPLGSLPNTATFRVAGLYNSGHYEFDNKYVFLALGDAQDLLKLPSQISGWQIWGKGEGTHENLVDKVQPLMGEGMVAESWKDYNSALFASLKLEQWGMFLVLAFAVAIAGFGVVITLIMYVIQKKRSIGILRCMGASKAYIRKVFVYQGFLLGSVGMVLGTLLSVCFFVYIRYFSHFELPDFYYDRTVPFELRPQSIFFIYLFASMMVFVATLFPSKKASEWDPISAIKE